MSSSSDSDSGFSSFFFSSAAGAAPTAPPASTLTNLDLTYSISSSKDFPLSSPKTLSTFSVSDFIPTELRIFSMSTTADEALPPKTAKR
ncbi:hypothetical protein WA026_007077 [Henosepilachna vigintioctopunctata]|uniref:Secreted protein n=1 Tax=Henosepilachna vigintioctopunctata TaxID=420089 RepID=A0AAW1V808_9CUCU